MFESVTYVNQEDYVSIYGWDFAGWRNDFDLDEFAVPTQELRDGELGCSASRILTATGGLLPLIKKYYPDETDWILKHDWTNIYQVKSGWKK